MVSLRRFAKMAGVSPSTVSRIFSNNGYAAKETRDRIIALAEACNFRPSVIRPASPLGNTHSIGVVLPSLGISYFADIFQGIQSRLFIKKFLPILVDASITSERDAVNRLIDHKVDGLILSLVGETLDTSCFKNILHLNLPMISIGPVTAGFNCDVVDGDDMNGGLLATEHLIALGHTRIGFCFYGEGINSSCNQRFLGFRRALEKHRLPYREKYSARIRPGADNRDLCLKDDLSRILSAKNAPTAFFAPTDLIALSIYEVAGKLKISIPGQLSVVGFADLGFAPHIAPPLTTIRQDGFAIGKTSAELILKRLNDTAEEKTRTIVPVELILRNSTGQCHLG